MLAWTISGEVTMGSYRGYVVWDFMPGRSYQGEQARYHQLMTEPWPALAGYGEVLVLQQDVCGLCSRWFLSWKSMVCTTRFWAEELLQNQPTAKITQFSQRTTVIIHLQHWQAQLVPAIQRPFSPGTPPNPVR